MRVTSKYKESGAFECFAFFVLCVDIKHKVDTACSYIKV